jgi:PIN domain nuclease of toxin-antitoxin system
MLTMGLRVIPMDGVIGVAAAGPDDFHADPVDRMIVATMLRVGATLLTADERILRWSGDFN